MVKLVPGEVHSEECVGSKIGVCGEVHSEESMSETNTYMSFFLRSWLGEHQPRPPVLSGTSGHSLPFPLTKMQHRLRLMMSAVYHVIDL